MKHKLKKINRGIVLAVILVIVMTIYIIIDYSNFKKEIPMIKTTVTDYVDELSQFNIAPEKYQSTKCVYSDEDKNSRISEFNVFADKYWTNNDYNDEPWTTEKKEFKNLFASYIDDLEKGFITECSSDVENIIVKKDGPNSAVVVVKYKINYVGSNRVKIINNDDGYGYYDYDEEKVQTDALYKHIDEISSELNLYRTDDGWKVYNCWSYIINSNKKKLSDIEKSEGSEG